MRPAIGFYIAGHIGQNLIPRAQAAAIGQRELRGRVRDQQIGIHPVMGNGDLGAQFGREGVGLPFGRGKCRIGLHHGQRQMRLPRDHAKPRKRVGAAEFRVKPYIQPGGAIIEFGIDQQSGLRENLCQEQGFAPTAMPEDHIGHEPQFVAQLRRRAAHAVRAVGHGHIGRGQPRLPWLGGPDRAWGSDRFGSGFAAGCSRQSGPPRHARARQGQGPNA